MKNLKSHCLPLALLLGCCGIALAQSLTTPLNALNLDFEKIDVHTKQPLEWYTRAKEYQMAADSVVRHGGRYSLRIQSDGPRPDKSTFGVATLQIPVIFQGKILKKLFELAEFEYPPDVCQANPGIGMAQTSVVFL